MKNLKLIIKLQEKTIFINYKYFEKKLYRRKNIYKLYKNDIIHKISNSLTKYYDKNLTCHYQKEKVLSINK